MSSVYITHFAVAVAEGHRVDTTLVVDTILMIIISFFARTKTVSVGGGSKGNLVASVGFC